MTENYIPLEQCVPRHVYRIHSRNLAYGVFDGGNAGFIGHFAVSLTSIYLFTEMHWDTGAPFGTVKPVEIVCHTAR